MSEKKPVLKASHLGIQFGGLKAVDDFNMEIGESELIGLIGPNGAGKTTVFNLLTGVYQPTEGAFYLCGEKSGNELLNTKEGKKKSTTDKIRMINMYNIGYSK